MADDPTVDFSKQDQVVQVLAGYGLPYTQEGVDFLYRELQAEHGRGQRGWFRGFKLPPNVNQSEFFDLLSEAEQWAAAVGWNYLPTPSQLVWGAQRGVAHWDKRQLYQLFGYWGGMKDSDVPWVRAGYLNYDDYRKAVGGMKEALYADVGEVNPGAEPLIDMAMQQGWSAGQLSEWIRKDPTWRARYPWIRHGMSYDQWQQFRLDKKGEVERRYGVGATSDVNYISMLEDPLQKFAAEGGPVRQLGEGTQEPGQRGGWQSSIR